MNEGLDYEIVFDEDDEEWHVWTPERNGAILGFGKTKADAIRSAIQGIQLLLPVLTAELKQLVD